MCQEYDLPPFSAMNKSRAKHSSKGLDRQGLRQLAMSYVARYATTGLRLERYLNRKIRQQGWTDEAEPDVHGLIAKFQDQGFIDDASYAEMRSQSLLRKGYGGNRIHAALRQAGIAESISHAVEPAESEMRGAACLYAQKRRFGPYGTAAMDAVEQCGVSSGEASDHSALLADRLKRRDKQIAAMLRAGHSFDHSVKIIDAEDEEVLTDWIGEAQD